MPPTTSSVSWNSDRHCRMESARLRTSAQHSAFRRGRPQDRNRETSGSPDARSVGAGTIAATRFANVAAAFVEICWAMIIRIRPNIGSSRPWSGHLSGHRRITSARIWSLAHKKSSGECTGLESNVIDLLPRLLEPSCGRGGSRFCRPLVQRTTTRCRLNGSHDRIRGHRSY